jgi:hypothetical protein
MCGLADQVLQQRGQGPQLPQVKLGEGPDAVLPGGGQLQPDDSPVDRICSSGHEAESFHSTDQFNDTVMAYQQVLRGLGDRRAPIVEVAFNCQQQLVLAVGKPHAGSLRFAPPVEAAQRGAECKQSGEIKVGQLRRLMSGAHDHSQSDNLVRPGGTLSCVPAWDASKAPRE